MRRHLVLRSPLPRISLINTALHLAFFCLVCFCLVCFCLGSMSPASAFADETEEFESLFDGKTMTGWRGYKRDDVPTSWTVHDGAIRGAGKGPDLMYRKAFGDFDLRFEWKLAKSGNSGVIYRVTETEGPSHHTGPEFQLIDDQEFADKIRPTNSTGALYGLYGATEKTLQPIGEYNTSRIVVRGNRIEHWLNGEKIVDCEIGSEDWNKKVAASKFHKWKGFAKNSAGHIVLQSHGSPVWFREILVKELPAPTAEASTTP